MTTQKETQLERARGIQSELLGLLEGMDYCLDWKLDSTAWSVREIVYHLLDTPAGGVHTVLRGILSGEITEFEVWADRTNITPERQSNDFEAVVEEITVLFRGIQAALESAGEQDLGCLPEATERKASWALEGDLGQCASPSWGGDAGIPADTESETATGESAGVQPGLQR